MLSDELFYVRQISPRLKLFKQTQRNHFQFRCPLCGDSKISEWKARGGIYPRGENMMYGCFNCGASMRFSKFLKGFDPGLYREYVFDKFKAERTDRTEAAEKPVERSEPPAETDMPKLLGLTKVFPVSASSTGKEYLRSRFVTDFSDVYYTNDAMEVIAKYRPETKNVRNFKDKHAIMFPLMTVERAVYGVQLRFMEGDFRYMTIMVDSRFAKVFGSHRVDLKSDIWVTEGIFDAYMLGNAVANLDSALHMVADKMKLPVERFVLVYDNEPRNRDVMKMMRKGVERGYRVFFWPREAGSHGKDLNDIRRSSPEFFKRLMGSRNDFVHKGLHGKLQMQHFCG